MSWWYTMKYYIFMLYNISYDLLTIELTICNDTFYMFENINELKEKELSRIISLLG